jgi:hypothetical protein
MSGKIIPFRGALVPLFLAAQAHISHSPAWMGKTRHAKNPLRKHVNTLASATIEANRLPQFIEDYGCIREGIVAANLLALELARILEANGQKGIGQ